MEVYLQFAVHFCQLRSLQLDPCLKLGGEVIKVVEEAKILDILVDRKLTFIPHIKSLKARCLKALGVVKVVASTGWGATCDFLLQLYRAFVRSKLDYGKYCVWICQTLIFKRAV